MSVTFPEIQVRPTSYLLEVVCERSGDRFGRLNDVLDDGQLVGQLDEAPALASSHVEVLHPEESLHLRR